MLPAEFVPAFQVLLNECARQQISVSLHWNEHDDSWYAATSSPAPSERHVTRDYSCPLMAIRTITEQLTKK